MRTACLLAGPLMHALGPPARAALPLPPPGAPALTSSPCIRRAGGWEKHLLHDFGAPVWRVSWSVSGNILSASDASNAVTLWKEAADGTWQQITQ